MNTIERLIKPGYTSEVSEKITNNYKTLWNIGFYKERPFSSQNINKVVVLFNNYDIIERIIYIIFLKLLFLTEREALQCLFFYAQKSF